MCAENGAGGAMLAMKDPEGHTEHRRDPRKEVKVEIGLHGENNFYTGITENISKGGVFVATHEPHEIGAFVELEVTLPGINRPIKTSGKVRWVRPYKET